MFFINETDRRNHAGDLPDSVKKQCTWHIPAMHTVITVFFAILLTCLPPKEFLFPVKSVFHGTRHIRVQSFKDDVSNNLIECFNKQFKAWYKTKQGFSSFESANNLISMFVFFFNFVRPHSALNGLTPAQVAGLSLSTRKKRDFPLIA